MRSARRCPAPASRFVAAAPHRVSSLRRPHSVCPAAECPYKPCDGGRVHNRVVPGRPASGIRERRPASASAAAELQAEQSASRSVAARKGERCAEEDEVERAARIAKETVRHQRGEEPRWLTCGSSMPPVRISDQARESMRTLRGHSSSVLASDRSRAIAPGS